MKNIFVSLAVLGFLASSSPAFAQNSVIKVIQDNGRVDTIDITPKESDVIMNDAPAPEELPEVGKPAPAPVKKEAAPSPELLKEQAAPEVVKEEPPKKVEAKPAAKPKLKTKKAKPKPAPEVKAPARETRDPLAQKNLPPVAPAPDASARIDRLPDGKITPEAAIGLALPHAPPAVSMSAVERVIDGNVLVYAVTFRTENGPVDVIVDAFNGAVLLVK